MHNVLKNFAERCSIMNDGNILFSNIETLIAHLKFLKEDKLTPIRLQKALYFLFAFYGASYGQLNDAEVEVGVFEGGEEDTYPRFLFAENFEAWKFGPVIPTVYRDFKTKTIESAEWHPDDIREENVKQLIGEVMTQLDEMGDFELVERTHEDDSWKLVYNNGKGQSDLMNHDDIINDYRTSIE